MLFADLLSLHLVTFLMFCNLVLLSVHTGQWSAIHTFQFHFNHKYVIVYMSVYLCVLV